jgi:hypothetical protein
MYVARSTQHALHILVCIANKGTKKGAAETKDAAAIPPQVEGTGKKSKSKKGRTPVAIEPIPDQGTSTTSGCVDVRQVAKETHANKEGYAPHKYRNNMLFWYRSWD